jgi:membrane dipeptidase
VNYAAKHAGDTERAVKVAGIDHVGVGADFGGIPSVSHGLENLSKVRALWKALQPRGYSESDIQVRIGTAIVE